MLEGGDLSAIAQRQARPNPALGGGGFKLGLVTYNLAKDWDLATIIKNCGQAAQGLGMEVWLDVHGRESSEPRRITRMIRGADHQHAGVCWTSNPEDVVQGSVQPACSFLLSRWPSSDRAR